MKNIIRNSEGRLRSGWRVLFQLVGFFILLIVAQGLQIITQDRQSALLYGIGSGIYLLGVLCILWGFARWIDRRKRRGRAPDVPVGGAELPAMPATAIADRVGR